MCGFVRKSSPPASIALTRSVVSLSAVTKITGMRAVRGSRFKYIRYYGLWDTNELYDLQVDPLETRNLIRDPAQGETVARMNAQLFEVLAQTGGMYIPLSPDAGGTQNLRRRTGSKSAEFPPYFFAQEK